MLGYLFPLCRRTPLRLRLGESMKRRKSEGLCGKPRDVNKPGMFVQKHNLFSVSKKEARSLFRFLKLVILTSSWTRFHCLSREAKSSDCCFDRYKSQARLFRSSCVIQCGSLPLVPEYVNSIYSKDIDSAESSLEGISSSDEEKNILIYWRCVYRKIIWMGNGSHSRSKVEIFDLFPWRCIETSCIS